MNTIWFSVMNFQYLSFLLAITSQQANGDRLDGSQLRNLQGGPPGGGGGGGPPGGGGGGSGGGGGATSCSTNSAPAFMTPSAAGDCLTSFEQGTFSSYPEVKTSTFH